MIKFKRKIEALAYSRARLKTTAFQSRTAHSRNVAINTKLMIVDFFKNLFDHKKEESGKKELEEYSTYLTPWYFKGSIPNLGENLVWKELKKLNGEKLALTTLNSKNNRVGIIEMYCYIKPLQNGKFLIWKRGSRKIELYDSADLKPLETVDFKWTELGKPYLFNAKPIGSLEYFIDLYQTDLKFDFPAPFSDLDEIIQVNDLDGMYEDYSQGMGNTAIVVLKPRENRISIYPQDWFNRANDIDFGYQWITRADRIGTTDKIKIQGIQNWRICIRRIKKRNNKILMATKPIRNAGCKQSEKPVSLSRQSSALPFNYD